MDADYFDRWYADIAASQARQALFTEYLGLPPEVGPSNLVPLTGLQAIADALAVTADDQLVDLGCGRGGPGMWIARATGCDLIGIDFSPRAVEQATQRRALFGLGTRATFAVGSLENTGLGAGSADAVVSVDAFQFATSGAEAAAEIRRILRPGGHVALTSWEAVDRGDESLSERLRQVDLASDLDAAGFAEITVETRADWHDNALRLHRVAAAIDTGGDPALQSLREESNRSVAHHAKLRRVMATATAPTR